MFSIAKFSLWISAAEFPPDDNKLNSRCGRFPFLTAFQVVVLLLTRWPVACTVGNRDLLMLGKAAPQWCARSSSATQSGPQRLVLR